MSRLRAAWPASLACLALVADIAGAADPPVGPGPGWPFDEVVLTNGALFRGLILNETPAGLDFQVVKRQPGRATVVLTTSFSKKEVAAVRRLSDADRAVLREKLADLDPTGAGERRRMDALTLAPADWLGTPGGAARYESDQFVLVSGAGDEVTRRAAVRLEQVYAAFARVLPPRREAARPTTVFLAGTTDDYRKLLGPAAGGLLNPAVYDPAANRVVCGSDLRKLGDDLAAAKASLAKELAAVARYEAEVRQLYKGQQADLDRFLDLATRERARIDKAAAANSAAFDAATRRLFALLYHEAFHSYTSTFVYPPLTVEEVRAGQGTGELPRWLNEGLAQVFETAGVEAGELQIGHADADRLGRVRDRLSGKGEPGLTPVADLLRAGRDTFLTAHADGKADANRAYLTAWAATFYLTFEKRVIGGPEFEAYLAAVNTGSDPVAAFEKWVGQDVPGFEKDLHEYLGRLRPDGSAPRK